MMIYNTNNVCVFTLHFCEHNLHDIQKCFSSVNVLTKNVSCMHSTMHHVQRNVSLTHTPCAECASLMYNAYCLYDECLLYTEASAPIRRTESVSRTHSLALYGGAARWAKGCLLRMFLLFLLLLLLLVIILPLLFHLSYA